MREYKKGVHYSPATEFFPGISPKNKLPVGAQTVRIDKKGKPRNWIKISEPNRWVPLAQHVWGVNHGPVPNGYIVHHVDGNSLNDSLDNFQLVTREDHIRLHHAELRSKRPAKTYEKTKVCPDCGLVWLGTGRRVSRCTTCSAAGENIAKKTYRDRKRSERQNAVKYCQDAETQRSTPGLFDAAEEVEADAFMQMEGTG